MRLAKADDEERFPDRPFAGVECLKVLILLLDLPCQRTTSDEYDMKRDGEFWGDKLTVGQVLDECYSHGILEAPMRNDCTTYKSHVAELTQVLWIINMWHFMGSRHCPSHLASVDEIRNATLADICEHTNCNNEENANQPKSDSSSFQCHNMSLELVRRVGKLKVM